VAGQGHEEEHRLKRLDLTIPASSVEFVEVTVSAKADPTGAPVSFAMTTGAPVPADFKVGDWDLTQSQPSIGTYVARFLFGSANFPATAGEHYNVHMKIDAAAEDPVLYVGQIHTT
jgi:hypothetical protein